MIVQPGRASVPERTTISVNFINSQHRQLQSSIQSMQLLARRTPQPTILDALPELLPERSQSRVNLPQKRLVPEAGLIEPSSVQMAEACTEPNNTNQCKQADDTTAQESIE